MKHLLILALALLPCVASAADWELDEASSTLSFVSLKNVDIAEAHRFSSLAGQLDSNGQFSLDIKLGSVDTKVPLRDERMIEHVFAGETDATVEGQVNVELLTDLGVGNSVQSEVRGNLKFRGKTTPLVAQVQISAIADGQLQVVTVAPILVSARTLGVADGIETLRELAALTSISMAVPVYFSLTFRRVP